VGSRAIADEFRADELNQETSFLANELLANELKTCEQVLYSFAKIAVGFLIRLL
jgi:hypothetical protein